jgi:hypothetical protein
MKSYKEFHIDVLNQYDYMTLSKEEKDRIQKIVMTQLEDLASKFDGPIYLKINLEGKGNC